MNINFNHPITGEKCEISVVLSVPCETVKMKLESIIDTFPVEKQAALGKPIINMVNSAMKNNAVSGVVYSDDIFRALAERVTYGAYTIKAMETGTGYELNSVSMVDKEVSVFSKTENKTVKERRKAFVTYADCVKFVKALNRENKKNGIDAFAMSGDFTASEMRKIRYFIPCVNGRLSDDDRAKLAERGTEYACFLADRFSNDGRKARVQTFYDIFNRHTGKAVKAIARVENNVVDECKSYNSMYKLDKDGSEFAYISALFNEWLNSELATATSYKAKAPEFDSKKKKVKASETKA
jgi:hypothetical protein